MIASMRRPSSCAVRCAREKNGPAQSSVVEIASHRLRLGCRQAPAPAPHACERRPSATLPARPGRTGLCSTDDAVRISARERATDPVGKESVQLQELANVVVRQRVARKLQSPGCLWCDNMYMTCGPPCGQGREAATGTPPPQAGSASGGCGPSRQPMTPAGWPARA